MELRTILVPGPRALLYLDSAATAGAIVREIKNERKFRCHKLAVGKLGAPFVDLGADAPI